MDPACEPGPENGSAGAPSGRSRPDDDRPVYSSAFWIAYAANTALVAGNALTFRFAELVDALGGKERTAGLIVGVATAAALTARFFLGQALDRYGVRRLWLLSSVLFIAGGALLAVTTSLAWPIYTARSLFAIGLAGMFTCSTLHVQNLVPPHRRTEVIGSLGSSGFLGMIAGAVLGDVIFHSLDGERRFTVLFGSATLLGAIYLALVLYVTRRDRHVPPAKTPPFHHLALRYWPGNVMLVAFAMGTVFAVTTVFLTRFATHRHLSGIGPFFAAYAGSAFTFRIVARGWSRTIGRHRMILLGLAGHTVAMLLFPFVTTEWLFVPPALLGGFGHALLFPAVVSLGSEAFPKEYRGTGTTLVMGFFEVGTFASAPVLGGIIDAFDRTGFTPMFLAVATLTLSAAAVYLLTTARTPDSDVASLQPEQSDHFADEPLATEPFARQSSAPQFFARQESVSRPSAREPFAPGSSAREYLGPEGPARVTSARQGSLDGISARQESAAGMSAREGTLPARPADSTVRGGAAIAATRCR